MFTVLKHSHALFRNLKTCQLKFCVGVIFWRNKHSTIVHQQVCLLHSTRWFVVPYWDWYQLGVAVCLSVSLDHLCLVYLFEYVDDMFLLEYKIQSKDWYGRLWVLNEGCLLQSYKWNSYSVSVHESQSLAAWSLCKMLSACAVLFDESRASDFRS
jgi:hypothetical protein